MRFTLKIYSDIRDSDIRDSGVRDGFIGPSLSRPPRLTKCLKNVNPLVQATPNMDIGQKGKGIVARCFPSAQYNTTERTSDTAVVAGISLSTSGPPVLLFRPLKRHLEARLFPQQR